MQFPPRPPIFLASFFAVAICVATSVATAQEKQLLWGDTHLHSSYSFDAYASNNYTADPSVAYAYARGYPVLHPYHRARVQIETPLDFLVVSDHAALLGTMRHLHLHGLDTSELGLWEGLKAKAIAWYIRRRLDEGTLLEMFLSQLPAPQPVREAAARPALSSSSNFLSSQMQVQVDTWKSQITLADEHNAPGEFTALIGWEWSSLPGGANLHRVVLTDGDASVGGQFHPFSMVDSQYPEDLWAWLDETSARVGADFIAIPHNSNVSKGFMFGDTRLRGTPFDADYIALRMKWEPLVEVTQIKGDSETHPVFSPEDEFADFEEFPVYLQSDTSITYEAASGEYVREALRDGLEMEREFGENPYAFGLIGSTDAHTGLASAEEDNFWGKLARDSIPENNYSAEDPTTVRGWSMSASGLAAVYAQENTRESIVAAMRRKETYATTGPRIQLQFYAGKLSVDMLDSVDLYAQATAAGVPMGGTLNQSSESPIFIVRAAKDPLGANLDRVQIVKGWLDASGDTQEKVHDVAWSGDRQRNAQGRLEPVGNTVAVDTGLWTNTIGSAQLAVYWEDPNFDPTQPAFYYVRVLQIPTPRHSLLDAIALGLEHAQDKPDTIQERAYSSPIWYNATEASAR